MAATMHDLLTIMIERGASDLHITTGTPPQIRLHGKLTPLTQFERLTPQDTQRLAYSVLNEGQKQKYEEDNELDLSFGIQGLARFRCNVYRQRGAVGAAIRVIPIKIRSFEELGLPSIVEQLADRPKGLVLVTGPTGSGKSTTLAAMVDKVNSERSEHIMTIEDPIEFVHNHKKCLVNQREVFSDTQSFKNALKYILRQDPDVVLVGEMRDLETISAALTIAETGHLTLGTLHTNSCAQTMNRIIDVFPTSQQSQVRAQLSLVLEGVLSKQLIPTHHARHPEPDPRGEDPPDLLRDAGGPEVRDADDEPVAPRAGAEAQDHPRGSAQSKHAARGAHSAHRHGERRRSRGRECLRWLPVRAPLSDAGRDQTRA